MNDTDETIVEFIARTRSELSAVRHVQHAKPHTYGDDGQALTIAHRMAREGKGIEDICVYLRSRALPVNEGAIRKIVFGKSRLYRTKWER